MITVVFSIATLWMLLLAAGLPFPAVRPVLAFGRDVLHSRVGRLGCAWIALILLLNVWETSVDSGIGKALELDFTPLVFAIEGNVGVRLQQLLAGPQLDVFWTWVYIFLYPGLLILPLLVFHHQGRRGAARGYIGAFSLNYLFAIPFYLFAPVVETGVSGLTDVQPVLDSVWPRMLALLRSSSAPDNCFPSLHASCALTVAFYAYRHGPRRLFWIAAPGAALTLMSTWALGIHWLVDGLAGLVLALAAVAFGPRLVERALIALPDPEAERAFSRG